MTLTRPTGVYAIAVTPFEADGRVDADSIDSACDFYLGKGANGLTVLGILGEAPKLHEAESRAVAERYIKRAGAVPVIVGVSAPGFAAMRALALDVTDQGAAGVMIAPPSHLRTDDQIVGYFNEAVVAIGSDIPFVLLDYPLTLQVVMSNGVIRQFVENHPSCVCLKHEDWPGLDKITALRRMQRDGKMRDISILCGNGGLFLDFEMGRGADGAMTGYAFPEMLRQLVDLSGAGRREEAHDLFDAHLPLLRYEHQQRVGLAGRKYILKKRGAIRSDAQRGPRALLSPEAVAEVDFLLARSRRACHPRPWSADDDRSNRA